MLNRRLIRIKVFKVLYSAISSDNKSISEAESQLMISAEKSRDLYYYILNLSIALKRTAQAKIDTGLKKLRPTPEETNPNMKFVNNQFASILETDKRFVDYCDKKGLLWRENDLIFVKKLYAHISEQDWFREYMGSSKASLEEDCNLFKRIYEELEDNEELYTILEDESLFWIDDIDYILNYVLKSIDNAITKGKILHPDVFLKDDDLDFAKKLLEMSVIKYDSFYEIVSEAVENWDSERLVYTDMVLIIMGLTEAVTFEGIPVKVTINEYVEIAKYYSTPNSRLFVNGILDKLIQQMVADGEIVKVGRGLIDS